MTDIPTDVAPEEWLENLHLGTINTPSGPNCWIGVIAGTVDFFRAGTSTGVRVRT